MPHGPRQTRAPAARRVRKAATRAATETLKTRGIESTASAQILQRMSSSLAHLDEPSFRERLEQLLAPVNQAAPGLFGPRLADWTRGLAKVRNNEAHQLGGADDFGDKEAALYLGYATSARWALRLALLQQAEAAKINSCPCISFKGS